MKCFKSLAISSKLFDNLEKIDFKVPTPIQAQAIPHALEGKDVLGSAQTGTGKTGAFGIPLVNHLMSNQESSALVLLPTRELAMQVVKALKSFIGHEKIKTALLIGGEPMAKQYMQLKVKPRLIVATPGRTNDHLKRKTLKLRNTDFLVLDEVDRMLDMGFGVQLDEIAKYLVSERQTLMFTATLPPNIKKLAGKYLIDPVFISVGATHAPAEKVKQDNIKLAGNMKYTQLLKELDEREGSILVFIGTKIEADRIALKLQEKKYSAKALHGDLQQSKRTRVTEAFRKKKCRILVATDVAARGLDIPHIEHVINYDLPQNPEDYIHRIGRTARAGAEGHAINFISPKDSLKWRAIARLINPNAVDKGSQKSSSREGGKKSFSDKKRGGSSFSQRNSRYSDKKGGAKSSASVSKDDSGFSDSKNKRSSEKKGGGFFDRIKRKFSDSKQRSGSRGSVKSTKAKGSAPKSRRFEG